ncbi:hypothetical protein F8155_24025 [Priestia endophytica]|nr:hypothetical protein F8155_24025 [Priestia endophytica]
MIRLPTGTEAIDALIIDLNQALEQSRRA